MSRNILVRIVSSSKKWLIKLKRQYVFFCFFCLNLFTIFNEKYIQPEMW